MGGGVVVTGASSFVGCHLARGFAAAGWEVVATHSTPLDRYDGIRRARLDHAAAVARLEALDLTDGGAIAAFVARVRPQVWIQHAGHATGYASSDYPLMDSLAVNLAPLEVLYPALAAIGAGLVVTGSAMEYAPSDTALAEDAPCLPDTPYGLSKLAETLRTRQLAVRYGVPTRVARLFIPFGPLDHPAKLLSQVVAALAAGRTVDLSAGLQQRDFVGVSDVVRGYGALVRDLPRTLFDIFNLASGRAVALRGLLTQVAAEMGADPALLRFGALPMRPGEAPVQVADVAKAERLLGWIPVPLDQAVRVDLLGRGE